MQASGSQGTCKTWIHLLQVKWTLYKHSLFPQLPIPEGMVLGLLSSSNFQDYGLESSKYIIIFFLFLYITSVLSLYLFYQISMWVTNTIQKPDMDYKLLEMAKSPGLVESWYEPAQLMWLCPVSSDGSVDQKLLINTSLLESSPSLPGPTEDVLISSESSYRKEHVASSHQQKTGMLGYKETPWLRGQNGYL